MTVSRRLIALACALCVAGGGAFAAPALGAGNPIFSECPSGTLSHAYTVTQLRHALAVMPATVKQYTSCFDVVQQALLAARKHGGLSPGSAAKKSTSSSSSFLPTPVIIILVVLILAAVTFGALAIRRRRSDATVHPAGTDAPGSHRATPSDEPRGSGDPPRDDDARP